MPHTQATMGLKALDPEDVYTPLGKRLRVPYGLPMRSARLAMNVFERVLQDLALGIPVLGQLDPVQLARCKQAVKVILEP